MDLEAFTSHVDTVLLQRDLEEQRWQQPLPVDHGPFSRPNAGPMFDGLLVKWETGGVDGGNWTESSENHSFSTGASPAEMTSIDAVLEDVCPTMPFTAYKDLLKLVQHGAYEEREYYGNRADYAFSCISLEVLHGFLAEHGYLPGPACTPR